MSSPPVVVGLGCEYRADAALGIGDAEPRLSWETVTDAPDWWQRGYEIEVDGENTGWIESDESALVDWPASPLRSRQRASVRVCVGGVDGSRSDWSAPLVIETGLLDASDWIAQWITSTTIDPEDRSAPAPWFRRAAELPAGNVARARLYVTSAGVHRVHLNGVVVGDHVLAPGWSAYPHRLRYETHDVTALVRSGQNVLGAVVADGWWRGQLGWEGERRNRYGTRLGLLAQLEVEYADGSVVTVGTDDEWRTTTGPILSSDLYDGEHYDARLELTGWDSPGFDDTSWSGVETFSPEVGALVAPSGPPVRRIERLPVAQVITTPSGRTVLDFGQNLVGRVRFTVEGDAGTTIEFRHAEVLEHGEPAYEPLRSARATDTFVLAGRGMETWEPEFTFHGFRYVEVTGWPGELDPAVFEAVVLHSDMRRTGTFTCDHPLLDQLHRNVVWGMRGNFLDVPTDCPQRDERIGWTGDLQVFAPTASYLYDVRGVLSNWLADLVAEQRADGSVPTVVPSLPGLFPTFAAGWSDAVAIVPRALYDASGDVAFLERSFDAMVRWVDFVAELVGPGRLWTQGFQYGDWLDPEAPNGQPWKSRTDAGVVATAYFARSAELVADAARVLGRDAEAARFSSLAAEIRRAFQHEYVTPAGRIMSDTATAYALALRFGLIEEDRRPELAASLSRVVGAYFFTISTGFLGTPEVLPALAEHGDVRSAYRLLTQKACPSWLSAVELGATTIWERWDSMLPDGTVNGSGMTSFNHYAFGAVAAWMHRWIGGLATSEPGGRTIRVAPVPGPGVTSADASLHTPYGRATVSWWLDGTSMRLEIVVPPNSRAEIVPPGHPDGPSVVVVGSGRHTWDYVVSDETVARWRDDDWMELNP